MRNQILSEISEVIRLIAARDNYSLILDISTVHFYSQAIDITGDVISEYNSLRN
jgi:Skp family chaperone for outer membrane proteins